MPVCSECGRETKTEAALKAHMRVHSRAEATPPDGQGDFTDFFYKTNDKRGYDLKRPFYCPRCGGKMLYHFSGVNRPRVGTGWVLGITLKCLHCCKVEHYGPPLDEEYKDEILRMRNGKALYIPWKDDFKPYTEDEEKEIKERLAKLGYF